MTYEGAVLVGIDENEPNVALLRWAAEEAVARKTRLVVCHVLEWASGTYPPVPVYGDITPELRTGPERIVGAAVDWVKAEYPDLDAVGVIGPGSPSRVLLNLSGAAAMVVVGARGTGGFPGLLLGSVSAQVAVHAHCPVAIVHAIGTGATDVVVGVDGSEESQRALELGLAEARRTGGSLVALHAYQLPPTAASYGLDWGTDTVSFHWMAERTLDEALGDVAERNPEVKIERRVAHGPVARVLLAESEDAAALVVGARGLGGIAGFIAGSISQQVMRHARCPILIAH